MKLGWTDAEMALHKIDYTINIWQKQIVSKIAIISMLSACADCKKYWFEMLPV